MTMMPMTALPAALLLLLFLMALFIWSITVSLLRTWEYNKGNQYRHFKQCINNYPAFDFTIEKQLVLMLPY